MKLLKRIVESFVCLLVLKYLLSLILGFSLYIAGYRNFSYFPGYIQLERCNSYVKNGVTYIGSCDTVSFPIYPVLWNYD